MGRIYSLSFKDVAVSVAQDLFAVLCSSSVPIAIHSVTLTQKTLTNWEAKNVSMRRVTATVTLGSGGSTPTPRPTNAGDAAAGGTYHANDTTVATSSGTIVDTHAEEWNFLNGLYYLPPPEDRPIIRVSEAFVVRLDTAPSAAMTCSGTLVFEELS
ncbi:MAG: hypothetical protein U1E56_13765 [Bauldia sp.]